MTIGNKQKPLTIQIGKLNNECWSIFVSHYGIMLKRRTPLAFIPKIFWVPHSYSFSLNNTF